MTRDELREKVAQDLSDAFLGSEELKGFYEDAAEIAIDTIFASLKEPTEEMMKTIGATSVQRLVWHKMLSASPLAPKEE